MLIEKVIKKICSLLVLLFYKLKYRKMLYFNYNSYLCFDTKFNIDNGLVKLGNIVTSYNCYFGVIGGKLTIGNETFFNRNTIIACLNEITIGNNVFCGPNVVIYDHDHKFSKKEIFKNEYKLGTITIGNNCWIGAGCIILKNTHIGEGSVIGAGSVVKGDIPSHSLVTSNRELNIVPIK